MSNPRDTQFAGFAKLLAEELPEPPIDDSVLGIVHAEWREQVELIIAQKTYDLVGHAFRETQVWHNDGIDCAVQSIPDMTEWPRED
jgi:hypothetical protein